MTQDRPRRLAAVWFADIVGYTDLSARDEDLALRLVRELQRIARKHSQSRGGRVVKLMGDAVLAVFDSVDGAVRAAIGLRDEFLAGDEAKRAGVSIRIGLHLGEVADGVDGDVYGDAVNTASRIERVAGEGQVVMSQAAFLTIQQRTLIEADDLGEFELKGLAEPIRLFSARLLEEEEKAGVRELLQEAIAPLQLLDVEAMGGMGEIYLARDPGLRRTLAVKVLKSELVADAQARSRFQREATVIAGLSHPNVITVHSVGELKDETPYFVMDYIEGGSLADRLEREGPVSISDTRRIVGEVASALQAAHGKGIVHRDIKAANVLWDMDSGRALVTDWGIAALDPTMDLAPETRLTKTGMFVGSPQYMSPEQLAGDDVGPETDLYSLGLLAFELLTGHGPFPAETPRELMIAHLREDPPSLSEFTKEVDPELDAVVGRCLGKNPETRPTAEEIARRFAPGAEAVLEWPPPGLEGLKGVGPKQLSAGLAGMGLLVTPFIMGFLAQVQWPGQGLIRDLTYGSAVLPAFFVLVVLFYVYLYWSLDLRGFAWYGWKGGATAAGGPGLHHLNQALGLGYGWRTVWEVLDDRWGDYGNLVAGKREYAVLDGPSRAKIRRRRARSFFLRLMAVAALPWAVIASIYLVNTGVVSPGQGLFLGMAPTILLGLLSLLPSEPNRVRVARANLSRPRQSAEMAASQAASWREAHRNVTGEEGPSPGWPTSRWTNEWYNFFSAVVIVPPALYFAFVVFTLAITTTLQPTPSFERMAARFDRVQALSSLRLSPDPAISPEAAAGVLRHILDQREIDSHWIGPRPGQETIEGSDLIGEVLAAPYSLSPRRVITKALEGLTAAETDYLRGFGGDPRLAAFDSLSRASGLAPTSPAMVPGRLQSTDAAGSSASRALQEVALHKLALAGLQISEGDLPAAETTLLSIYSTGLLLAFESNEMDEALLGRNVATQALNGLEQFYRGSGREETADLIRGGGSTSTPEGLGFEILPHEPGFREWLAASVTFVADPSKPRAYRLEALNEIFASSSCATLEGFLFGPPPELEGFVPWVKEELVRVPADEPHVAMAIESTERLWEQIRSADEAELEALAGSEGRFVFKLARFFAKVLRNPRFATCPAQLMTR